MATWNRLRALTLPLGQRLLDSTRIKLSAVRVLMPCQIHAAQVRRLAYND